MMAVRGCLSSLTGVRVTSKATDPGSTFPTSPSAHEIVTFVPVLSLSVACVAPTTAGMPSSRATMAAWQVRPPLSVMTPAAIFMTGSQSGLVAGATNLARLEGCEVPRGRNAARTSRRDFFPPPDR